jgi:non-heme chloroperoxidase
MNQIKIKDLFVDKISGNGHKILFIHGSSGGSWYWENYMRWFSEKGYECYAINLRFHAPNPSTPEQIGSASIYDYVEDVKNILAEIGEDTILMGHSMGGLIAQNVASTTQNLKAAIFICSAPPKGVKFKIVIPLNIFVRVISKMGKNKKAVKNKLPLPLDDKITIAYALNTLPKEDAIIACKKFVPESSAVYTEVMEGVPCPIQQPKFPMLTVGAKKDKTAHWKMQQKIADFHHTDFILNEDVCHMFMIEQGWELSAEKIYQWLKNKNL